MTDNRVTLRKRSPYATTRNQFRKVRTPGGRLTIQYQKKKGKVPRCGDTGVPLQGIPALRPHKYSQLNKSKKRVTRAYGGKLCASAVRDRIVWAFLVEENKVVKRVLRQQEAAARAAKKAAAKDASASEKTKTKTKTSGSASGSK